MTHSRTEDLVEIQQLLAKYAVTITQGDIDGLITVFTPDGTYSAFGSTYTLARFPELVDAAPKGLFMTGTSLVEPRRGRSRQGHRHTAAVLHRALQARHAHRLLQRHLRAHRRRVAAENPCHDVHPAQRRPRLRPSARDRQARGRMTEPVRPRRVPVTVGRLARRERPDAPARRRLPRCTPSTAPSRAEGAVRRGLDALRLAGIGGWTRRPGDPARRSSARRSSAAESTIPGRTRCSRC